MIQWGESQSSVLAMEPSLKCTFHFPFCEFFFSIIITNGSSLIYVPSPRSFPVMIFKYLIIFTSVSARQAVCNAIVLNENIFPLAKHFDYFWMMVLSSQLVHRS